MSNMVRIIAVQAGRVLFSEQEGTHLIALEAEGDIRDEEDSIRRTAAEKLGLYGDTVLRLGMVTYGDQHIYFIDIRDSEKLPADGSWKWHSLREYDSFRQEEIRYFDFLFSEINKKGLRLDYTYAIIRLVNEFRSGAHRPEIKERLVIDRSFSMGWRLAVVGFALALGIIFDLFFYAHDLAVSYPIFTVLLLSFFFFTDRDKIGRLRLADIGLLTAILLLSLTYGIYNNEFFRVLNFLAIPVLICVYTIATTNRTIRVPGLELVGEFMSRVFYQSFRCFAKPVFFVAELLPRGRESKNSGLRKNILIGLGASALLLLILIPMLNAADMAFNYYLGNIDKLLDNLDFGRVIIHLIIIGFISFYVFGYAWSFKYSSKQIKTAANLQIGKKLDPVIVITVLTVINLLYLLFTLVQFSYLYGGGHSLPQGLSYAEYARSGFFELAKVTVLNLIILLCAMHFAGSASRGTAGAMKVLFSLLVLFTMNMVVSAFYRMHLYEQSYGYTELRIYVYIFEAFLAIVFLLALAKIWYERLPLLTISMLLALILYAGVNYMNIESIIARNNIDRYRATGKIDMAYLKLLSVDADPQLVRLLQDSDAYVSSMAQEKLRRDLHMLRTSDKTWFEYNYFQSEVKKLLEKQEPRLGTDTESR